MKTKIVYVLACVDYDRYVSMLCLSLHTLLQRNHNTNVLVVMDVSTKEALSKNASSIFMHVKPVLVVIPPEYDILQRSRYLKTRLRKIVQGDFLYLDVDTLIARNLDDIDLIKSELALVSDINRPLKDGYCDYMREKSINAGFGEQDGEPYYNGGVMFVRDTPLAHRFFDTWHYLWKKSLANGVPMDQPALCEANRILGHPIQELSGIWNFQYKRARFCDYCHFITKTKILHYYSNNNEKRRILPIILRRVDAKNGNVDFLTALALIYPSIVVYDHILSMFRWQIKKSLGID